METITISTNYTLIWELKDSPNYKFTSDGICINTQRGSIVRKVVNSGCKGYCINGKFVSCEKLRSRLIRLKNEFTPF